jgi:serine/threonine protein kinase
LASVQIVTEGACPMIDPLPGDIFATGQVLNNTYVIEGVLGRGGTGEVYRARNRITGRVVAIKALNAEFSGNSDYLDLMRREEEMRAIRHDAVVQYTDCSLSDTGNVYLVMDFIDGPSLNDLMLRRRIDPRDLLIVGHRVADGLVATHGHGIVHRDLSPDNIILRNADPEQATIIDFGIAKDTAAGARTIVGNDFAGKYEYAAPEQLEGRAERRSDLYGLGASLLAAFRGEVPFRGASPGEMVRRKQKPLDTEGVPEPLKGLIDRLTQPEIDRRPASAQEVVDFLDRTLKPSGQKGRAITARGRAGAAEVATAPRRRGSGWLAVASLAIVAAAALYASGIWRDWITEPLPRVSPYVFEAARDPAGARLSGHAPDQLSADVLAESFAAATGSAPEPGAITLADGAPGPDWPGDVAEILDTLRALPEWSLSVSDRSATVTGLATDRASRTGVEALLAERAAETGFALATDLAAGPRDLDAAAVQAVLDPLATCGPLGLGPDAPESFPLGATIAVTGNLATEIDAEAITAALEPVIGDRTIRMDTVVLNPQICLIRAILPPAATESMSIWLGFGDTGEPNLSGIYHTGDNPVAEVLAPAGVTDGSLWVVLVDVSGDVIGLLPTNGQPVHALAEIGTVADGIRRVRVLHSEAEFRQNTSLPATLVQDTDFGKSELVAILTRDPLLDVPGVALESVESLAEWLKERIDSGEVEVLGIASRIIETRP